VDDPEFDAVFEKCAELRFAFLMQWAPGAFARFRSRDYHKPWRVDGFPGDARPPREDIRRSKLNDGARVTCLRATSKTNFIIRGASVISIHGTDL